jgi:hypothetical protein
MKEYKCKNCGKFYKIENWRKPSSYCSRFCKDKMASTWLLKTSFKISEATEEEKVLRLKENYEKHVIRQNGCWDWKGKSQKGYPKMTCRKALGANLGHRASWIIHNGKIPSNLSVLHKCDNKICTNPHHLFLGTNEDNVNDMLSKKRNPMGSKVGTSKLMENQVKEIKYLIRDGKSSREIAEKFNVTYQAISLIKNGINWKHVT